MPVFTAALFTVAESLHQLRCPSAKEWMRKYNVDTTEFCLCIKKLQVMSFPGKWIQLEITMLIKLSQTQEDKYSGFLLIYGNYTVVKIHMIMCVYVCVQHKNGSKSLEQQRGY